MEFILLNEIVDVVKEVITHPLYVKVASVNAFKESQYAGAIKATQVMLQNDCVWVTDTADDIMKKITGDHPSQWE